MELWPSKKIGSNEPWDFGDLWQPVSNWYGTNNTTNVFWNLAHEKVWRENTIWSENDSAYMIFLAYRYACYIKTSMRLKPEFLLLWYHLRKSKEQKKKNITQKEIKFPLAWFSWIFKSIAWRSRYHNSKIYPWVVSECTVYLFSSTDGCTIKCMMFNFHIQNNFHILENFYILESFHILDFYMNLYTFLYQAFHIRENSRIWNFSLTCNTFVPYQSFNTQVWPVEENKYIIK